MNAPFLPETPAVDLAFRELRAGRFRVAARGAGFDLCDELDLASETARRRFVQACDARLPGAAMPVHEKLEERARLWDEEKPKDDRSDHPGDLALTPLSEVPKADLEWLWPGFVPKGAITVLVGAPGVGKSLLLADLAARVSRGWPAPERNPAFDPPYAEPADRPELVAWFGGDSPGRALRPRLAAARANLDYVRVAEAVEHFADEGPPRDLRFPDDFNLVWRLRTQGYGLLVFDGLARFCRDAAGRPSEKLLAATLELLERFAEETGAAVVVAVGSLKGRVGELLRERARSVVEAVVDPENPARRIVASAKCNWGDAPEPVGFEVVPAAGAAAVRWLGQPAPATPAERAAEPAPRPSQLAKAVGWLRSFLGGGARNTTEVFTQAATDGIAESTLNRAKKALAVEAVPAGRNAVWKLPAVMEEDVRKAEQAARARAYKAQGYDAPPAEDAA